MECLDRTAERFPNRPALQEKIKGSWTAITWSEYRKLIRRAAKALIHLGVEAGDGVSLIGFNCPQWAIGDLAAIWAGAIPAGIYTTNAPEQCQYIAHHSESSVAIVDDAAQLAKFKAVRDQLAKLKAIGMMHGDDDDDDVYNWEAFLALADEVDDETLEARISAQDADDVCTLIYTSGTTGDPKAVMITHDNLTWTSNVALTAVGGDSKDRILSYLPFSHIAEQAVALHGPIHMGSCTYFAESMDALGDNLKEVRPTLFLGVPRVWEKIQAKMQATAKNNSDLKKKLVTWAKDQGLKGGYAMQKGKEPGLQYRLADKVIFSKVREALGLDQCRLQITSAAPISKSTLEFFLSLGIPLMEVYGMSECTGPATLSLPHKYRTGSVGWVLPGAEVKIAEDGEICMRGRHVFKGYMKNEAATAETIDDEGWLHSGDIGELDDDGFLRITDRKKDLIITAGGENIAPQVIEGKLKSIGVVSQAVVVGDRRKHLSALLTIDETKLQDALSAAGSSAKSMEEAAEDQKVQDWLMKQVEAVNKDLARVQTIKKIKVLPADLSIEGGELTPTMKVKRKIVNQKYADAIDAFYA
jgi:long-subunit acyl-CoA synthetase (AMP-forming)